MVNLRNMREYILFKQEQQTLLFENLFSMLLEETLLGLYTQEYKCNV